MKFFEATSFQDSNFDGVLDQPITLAEVTYVVKNDKSYASDSIVGKLIKYGRKPMCEILLTLFNLVLNNELVPTYWRGVL